ncbi:MAG TPA: DUF4019 domain-containing protein [Pyrinomonadaceae bacterium]|nr:DUF4019 domain-containing protein [Pyrinomonadaceae bacterium]
MKQQARSAFVNSPSCRTVRRTARRETANVLLLLVMFVIACNYSAVRTENTMPPQAQAALDAFSKDAAEERYEKIHNEAAEEWRQATTLDQSKEFFKTLKEKLGGVKLRTTQTVRDQNNTGGELPGRSIVVIYQTAFERAEGMETFTLVERDGRWLLARYFVNSSALK